MSSVAGTTRKLADELAETLIDKIASLRAAGMMEEALEEEKKLARIQRGVKADVEGMSLDETLTPNEKAAASFSGEGFERPMASSGSMTPTGMPEIDASDWSKALKPSPEEAQSMLNTDLSGIPGEHVEQVGNITKRSKIPGAIAPGAALAGTYAAFGTSGEKPAAPSAPPEITPPTESTAADAPVGGTGGGISASISSSGAANVTPEEAKNFLTGLTNMPSAPDMSKWKTDMAGIADQRQGKANELKASILEAKATADAAGSSVERRELIETITNAIGSVVAGMYGMKHGLDLSGAKFNKTDWNAKLDQINKQLQLNISTLKDEQELDQAVISERKDALMQDKEALLRDYENQWKKWQGKATIAQASQGQENRRVDKKFEADKFNAEMSQRERLAVEKAAREGKAPREQISAGLKEDAKTRQSLLDKWNALAVRAGDKKTTGEQRAVLLSQMGELDNQFTSAFGTPILPAKDQSGAPQLTPTDYSKLEKGGWFSSASLEDVVKQRDSGSIEKAVAQFQAPALQQLKTAFIPMREQYIAQYAQGHMAQGEPVGVAFEKAKQEYNSKLQNMFKIEAAYRTQGVR